MMKSLITAAVSASLIASPALAEVASQPSAGAGTAVPATEQVDGQQAMGNAIWWIAGAVVLGLLIFLVVLNDDDEEDLPASP